MSQYAWCEDSKSGLEFWKAIFKVINPEIICSIYYVVNRASDDPKDMYMLAKI